MEPHVKSLSPNFHQFVVNRFEGSPVSCACGKICLCLDTLMDLGPDIEGVGVRVIKLLMQLK